MREQARVCELVLGRQESSLIFEYFKFSHETLFFCYSYIQIGEFNSRKYTMMHVVYRDIVLVDETREGMESKLEHWRQTLEI